MHVPPVGLIGTARHYLGDLVYGAIDGVVTTFAVVAGVNGGGLTPIVAIVIGSANLLADGLSMAVGNYLSIRSSESARRAAGLDEHETQPARHALATFSAFAAAGALPLIPYLLPLSNEARFGSAMALTAFALASAGILRAAVTGEGWRGSALEMLGLGAAVAAVAYWAGRLVASLGAFA